MHEAVKPKTQMSGAVAGVCTILVTSFFMPYLYYLPSATLSSIIFMAIVALLQELPHDLQFMWKVKAWQDVFMLGIIFFTTMIYSLETGTALAVLFSLIITIRQTSYPRITIMVSVENKGKGEKVIVVVVVEMGDVDQGVERSILCHSFNIHINGPLIFIFIS